MVSLLYEKKVPHIHGEEKSVLMAGVGDALFNHSCRTVVRLFSCFYV